MSVIFTETSDKTNRDIPSGHVFFTESDDGPSEVFRQVNLFVGDGACHICGKEAATGLWRGESSIQVCFRCARNALPALMADALAGFLYRRSSFEQVRRFHAMEGLRGCQFWRDAESAFWRAFAMAMESAARRCADEEAYGWNPADLPSAGNAEDPNEGFPHEVIGHPCRVASATDSEGRYHVLYRARFAPPSSDNGAVEFVDLAVKTAADLPRREVERMIRIMRNWERAEAR